MLATCMITRVVDDAARRAGSGVLIADPRHGQRG
jgi:hypothetical protein